jgi:hypothetical protein
VNDRSFDLGKDLFSRDRLDAALLDFPRPTIELLLPCRAQLAIAAVLETLENLLGDFGADLGIELESGLDDLFL